ncbi:MAG TPA: hypothetical protein VKP60_21635, partial [Magnetospirillaceae bacterium]|nr:hypothetical protein [Magnetospirillaceae bacterium]
YRGGTHPINLLVWPTKESGDSEPKLENKNGFATLHWRQNGLELWAVSDIEQAQLETFVRLWRARS